MTDTIMNDGKPYYVNEQEGPDGVFYSNTQTKAYKEERVPKVTAEPKPGGEMLVKIDGEAYLMGAHSSKEGCYIYTDKANGKVLWGGIKPGDKGRNYFYVKQLPPREEGEEQASQNGAAFGKLNYGN